MYFCLIFQNSKILLAAGDIILIHNSFRAGYCIVAGHAGKHQFSVMEWEQGQTGVKWD